MSADSIAIEALEERARQVDLGWSPDHDAEHGLVHLYALALQRQGRIDWLAGELAYVMPSRKELIQAIALLIAAVEVMDENPS